MTGGRIQPHSTASAALRYLRALDRWVPNVELATHLGVARCTVSGHMAAALRRGDVEKRGAGRGAVVEWRLKRAEPAPQFSIGWPLGYRPQFFEARA